MWSHSRRLADRPRTIPQLEVLESRNLLNATIPSPPVSPVQKVQNDALTLFFNARSSASADTLKENLKTVEDDYKKVSLPKLSDEEVGVLFKAGETVGIAVANLGTRVFTDLKVAKLALDMTGEATQIVGGVSIFKLERIAGLVKSEQANVDSAIDAQPGASPQDKTQEKSLLDRVFQSIKSTIFQVVDNIADKTGNQAEAAEFTAPPPPACHDPDHDKDCDMY